MAIFALKFKNMATQKNKKTALAAGTIIFISLATIVLIALVALFAPINNNDNDQYIYIRSNDSFEMVAEQIGDKTSLTGKISFIVLSKAFSYDKKIRAGRYALNENLFNTFRRMRNGSQSAVQLTFNNIRTKEQLAGRLSKSLMADSASIIGLLNDSAFLAPYGLTTNNAVAVFIPDTYEIYWNVEAQAIFERMHKHYEKFWSEERIAKAAAIPLSREEVITLASIVEEETKSANERKAVAGLYINRLRKNMPLQADPTVKFAVGDFGLRRILFKHLRTPSPYNTYLNTGLPPGPIRLPMTHNVDAVLDFDQHNYIFMCAKETLNGEHNFAVTYAEHQKNARRYQEALNARNIR